MCHRSSGVVGGPKKNCIGCRALLTAARFGASTVTDWPLTSSHARTQAQTHKRTPTNTHTHTYTSTHKHTYVYAHTRAHTRAHKHTHTPTPSRTYTDVHTNGSRRLTQRLGTVMCHSAPEVEFGVFSERSAVRRAEARFGFLIDCALSP